MRGINRGSGWLEGEVAKEGGGYGGRGLVGEVPWEGGLESEGWVRGINKGGGGRGTAGHPHCLHAGVSVAGSIGHVAPCGKMHELLSLWGLHFSTE